MELILSTILSYFVGLVVNQHSDVILRAQKEKISAQLNKEKLDREAIKAYRPFPEDVRLVCIQLADKLNLLWTSPAQKRLIPLLYDPTFHQDFAEWLQAGEIKEGDEVKERLLRKMEALLQPAGVSNEQLDFLRNHFFSAMDKAIFADATLAFWRMNLSLQYLRERQVEQMRLNEAAAGIYPKKRQEEALDIYCQKALSAWDIIDLTSLAKTDVKLVTQQLLMRQLYMPLRIAFEAASSDGEDEAMLSQLEAQRQDRRLREAGRLSHAALSQSNDQGGSVAIGERLDSSSHLVVLGDPGAGKTTMLRWLATTYLLRHKGDPAAEQIPDVQTLPCRDWIPVLIRCRDIGAADLCRSFSEVLSMHLSKTELRPEDAKVMHAVILDRIGKGEVLLLVDGLDEITDQEVRVKFCRELECTAARYPDAPILVTSRIVGYRDMPYRMRSGFAHGVISDLQLEDKDQFARRWVDVTESHQTSSAKTKHVQELIRALHSNDRIERMTGNPMLLTTLALVRRTLGKLPTDRAELYDEAVEVLLRWNESYQAIKKKEALPQIAYLAYHMCQRGVQSLTGDNVLDLLEQFRRNYPNLRDVKRHDPEKFMDLLEARSSLLMRSGSIWQSKDLQEQSVWEFRHLTFQEYLASRALLEGLYKDQSESKTLAEQVALLAAPSGVDPRDADRPSREFAVSDSWRETLRLLVPNCRYEEVDAVLLSILNPADEEDAAKSVYPRAVLAAQCLAEEPNVSEETAREVLERLVSLIGADYGVREIATNLERAALEVWQSSWKQTLQACLVEAFSDGHAATRANCGGVLAQLLGSALAGSAVERDSCFEGVVASLESGEREEAICAALTVVHIVQEGSPSRPDALVKALLRLLKRGGTEGRAAAWALAWLSVEPPSDRAKRGPMVRNRLHPPVLATEWEGAGGGGWQPTEEQTRVLLEALGRAAALEGKRQLIELLGKSAQPSVVLPLVEGAADPDASVREAAREALAWLATHLSSPLHPAQLAALEEQVAERLVRNDALAEAERCDGLVVVALLGQERLLREVLANQGAPEPLRRRAAEGLGLVAHRCGDGVQRQRLREELEGWLRGQPLDLLVRDAAGWAEHDRLLPLPQGASRGLQLAASADLPLLGSGLNKRVPMLSLTALKQEEGLRIRTEVVTPEVWRLPLPEQPGQDPQELELVVVPGGTGEIGSPEEEEGRDCYQFRQKCEGVNLEAQRLVGLKAYALVRHPISQAQWRAVAVLPRVERDLSATPSWTKPDALWERHAQPGGLPVEGVRWEDCQEWLKRLNHWLKDRWPELGGQGEAPQLSLPSESQWEAACRAGCATPFHFGDTLDASWANYRGNAIYGPGREGLFRQRVVPIGAFGLVNRWGLAEMHGQLWEWCADRWHRDPVIGSAGDGSALEGPDSGLEGDQEQEMRLLRGGGWFNGPHNCRSACRISDHPAGLNDNVGFRVCCLPPGPLLGP
ncbi:MAG: SUMF1/EgtB/PvdO family nonheme iron enzyme [Cyanobacteriota bacterium]